MGQNFGCGKKVDYVRGSFDTAGRNGVGKKGGPGGELKRWFHYGEGTWASVAFLKIEKMGKAGHGKKGSTGCGGIGVGNGQASQN